LERGIFADAPAVVEGEGRHFLDLVFPLDGGRGAGRKEIGDG
jgi:hypothetical protein